MKRQSRAARRTVERLSKEHVGRIIGLIGKEAGIVVQQPNDRTGKRLKYASAHDIRRGCAQRLINAGISAETLKLIMRHDDFDTTERYYGAVRAVQSAANEIRSKLAVDGQPDEVVAAQEGAPSLSAEEMHKLKSLLNSL